MSGGSFNYLYAVDTEDLFGRLDDLDRMADAIGAYPDGEHASAATRSLAADLRATLARIDAAAADLERVWHAVEWHHSCDYSAEQVDAALVTYNRKAEGDGS